ncbi:glycosyltransferase [Parvibaculaceae bacterium PLY_AMNH_Bact1]|nr:glycosyltransferase [Parvibaculaceae bacterium PLY_AMNH_Bact1]
MLDYSNKKAPADLSAHENRAVVESRCGAARGDRTTEVSAQRSFLQRAYAVAAALPQAVRRSFGALSIKIVGWAYWKVLPQSENIYSLAAKEPADVWLANDWYVIPVAARLAREHGGIVGYDTHEFALNEYSHNLAWKFLKRPFVSRIEKSLIQTAPVCSTVSQGIADALQGVYDLNECPLVVRNVPNYQQVQPAERSGRLRVLYHGIVAPGRGLEACIDSVLNWREEFTLTIRGPAKDPYHKALVARIEGLGLSDRVRMVPPVPMTDLVNEAAAFDIGLFALPDHSMHNHFALPNKIFEYIMAGLAVCVSDLPEMENIVDTYGVGTTFHGMEPETIAAAINKFDEEKVNFFREKSLTAAQELCWEKEAKIMVNAYSNAVSKARA